MPEGMVPELLIAVALLAIVALAVFVGRRTRRDEAPPERAEAERPSAVETPVEPEVEEARPSPVVEVEPAPEPEAPTEAPRPTLRERLGKTRRLLGDRLTEAFRGGASEETWEDIEAALIQADVGVDVAVRISEGLRARARDHRASTPDEVKGLLVDELVSLFDAERERGLVFAPEKPTVWMIVGVNGTGKTTTIGKLAYDLRQRGHSVSLAAADTFRAAADEQLGVWAERAGAELVKHQPGADPGAVAFDAFKAAHARGTDVLLVDTAGRLHTKTPLMDELSKVRRVLERDGDVHECLLVLDATAGQNGLVQAREFAQAAGVTGVVLSKLDGTAKGGIAIAIEETLGIPIKLIGVGEGIDDLEPFVPKTFVDALLS